MNIPMSPAAEAKLDEQRRQYLASLPRKIECLSLPLQALQRNPDNAAAMAAIMAMVHQLCGSAALHRFEDLQKAAEHCRDQLEATSTPGNGQTDSVVVALMTEMKLLIAEEPGKQAPDQDA